MDIESETKRIRDFVDRGNFHAAMNLSISAMNACDRTGDRAGVDHFLELISEIVGIMRMKYSGER